MIDVNQIDLRNAVLQTSLEVTWAPSQPVPGFPVLTPVQVRPIGKAPQNVKRS